MPSMAFTQTPRARHPLHPTPKGRNKLTTLQASLHATDRPFASTPLRTQPLNHARGLHYHRPWHLDRPDSHRQAALNLTLGYNMNSTSSLMMPELLDTRWFECVGRTGMGHAV
jgi:hypothetical protein